jgi:hypothetical protein
MNFAFSQLERSSDRYPLERPFYGQATGAMASGEILTKSVSEEQRPIRIHHVPTSHLATETTPSSGMRRLQAISGFPTGSNLTRGAPGDEWKGTSLICSRVTLVDWQRLRSLRKRNGGPVAQTLR